MAIATSSSISQHQQAEAERARIRAEEQAKAQAEQAAAAKEAMQHELGRLAQASAANAAAHPAKDATTLTLGQINAMLAPVNINAAGLAELGFQPVATAKAAKLYADSDFPRICAAIAKHIAEIAVISEAA